MADINLDKLRQEIDALDDSILELLNRRAAVAQRVGQYKAAHAQTFYVPARERAIYERLSAHNPGPFPNDAVRKVFREIISASLSLEEPLKVAFLGPKATFTHVAAMQQFGLSAQLVAQKGISQVFEEVDRGRAEFGVVPVENSNEGIVSHTLDMFMESELKINAEILLEISHDLLTLSGSLDGVQRICSHPQALGQCRNWLEENHPDIPLVDVASTALAAQMAAEDPTVAAIASEAAGNMYGLQVAKNKIEDHPNNFTRFLVVGRTMPKPTGNDKTSIMFSVKDEPGILYRMLQPFSGRQINLSKIESRPMKRKAWEYIFFLDMEGHVEDATIAEALEDLKQYCQFIKVLGSFPRGR